MLRPARAASASSVTRWASRPVTQPPSLLSEVLSLYILCFDIKQIPIPFPGFVVVTTVDDAHHAATSPDYNVSRFSRLSGVERYHLAYPVAFLLGERC
jgi:hypothetical protein